MHTFSGQILVRLSPRCLQFWALNLHFAPFCLSSLVADSDFHKSIYLLLTPKKPLFNAYFALFGHVFNGFERLCLYHFSGYLCLSPCIQRHFALHLASNCTAFCTVLPCVLHQNALHLASKRTAFCTIFPRNQQQIAPKVVRMVAFLNKNSFCRIR